MLTVRPFIPCSARHFKKGAKFAGSVGHRGGATVLKVGGHREQKIFFDPPHFLASGGDKILLR